MLLPKPPALRPIRAASTRPPRACNKWRIRLQRPTMVPIKGRASNRGRDKGKIRDKARVGRDKARDKGNKVRVSRDKVKGKARASKVRARVDRGMEAAAARMVQGTIKEMASRYTFQDR